MSILLGCSRAKKQVKLVIYQQNNQKNGGYTIYDLA